MKNSSILTLLLIWSCFWLSPASAENNKLDNIAACAGVVIGNGAVDFFMGDEAAFDAAADIAYSAYLAEVLKGCAQTDIQIADQILASNLDKVIVAYNSETFDVEMYEEIVVAIELYRFNCLKLLRLLLIIRLLGMK